MATIQDQVKVTTKCRACGRPMHLWQDSSGSGWMHDTAADELTCWRENGAASLDDPE